MDKKQTNNRQTDGWIDRSLQFDKNIIIISSKF